MKKQFNEVASVKGYHIHIYFESGKASETAARELAETINAVFSSEVEGVHKIGKAGPHAHENYGVHVSKEGFGKIVPWLQLNSQGLSILIHPDTGDDLKDHLEASMWLGTPVNYNMAFFDKLKARSKGPSR